MHKWIAIRVSASLTILGSAATLLIAGVLLRTAFFVEPPEISAQSPIPFKTLLIALAFFFTAISVWGVLTAVATFRRRGWARHSMVIFSLLLVGMGGSALLGTLFMRMPQTGDVPPELMSRIRVSIAAFYGVMTAMGLWWLLLFNAKRTKEYFAQLPEARQGGRPFSITLIAGYLLFSTVATAVAAILRVPAFLFGAIITGWAALGVYTVYTALELYLGVSLLQMQNSARIASIIYFIAVAANAVIMVALPDLSGRLRLMEAALPRFLRVGQPPPEPFQGTWLFIMMGALYAAVPVYLLVRRRAAFYSSAPKT